MEVNCCCLVCLCMRACVRVVSLVEDVCVFMISGGYRWITSVILHWENTGQQHLILVEAEWRRGEGGSIKYQSRSISLTSWQSHVYQPGGVKPDQERWRKEGDKHFHTPPSLTMKTGNNAASSRTRKFTLMPFSLV